MRSLFAVLLMAVPAAAAAAPLTVYDDQLRNGFADWSWATHNLGQTAVIHGGMAAASFEPDAWQALFLHRDLGIDGAVYEAVDFWIHGGPGGGQNLTIALTVGGSTTGNGGAALAPFIVGGSGGSVPAGQWAKVHVPFASLGITSGTFDGFWLQDGTGGNQAAVYVDDVQLLESTAPPPPPSPVAVTIDPGADRRPVSPLIYGVNFGSAAQAARLRWPVRRWGGNSVTRYSWQHDISNHASDWFYYNIEEGTRSREPAERLGGDSSSTRHGRPVASRHHCADVGWTPIDRPPLGLLGPKYGAQQQTSARSPSTPPGASPTRQRLRPNGTQITATTHDTSREIGPASSPLEGAHRRRRHGRAGRRPPLRPRQRAGLWNSTHRHVHPNRDLRRAVELPRDYAAAMKAADPNVRILGPASWGCCRVFCSAADGCGPGAPTRRRTATCRSPTGT